MATSMINLLKERSFTFHHNAYDPRLRFQLHATVGGFKEVRAHESLTKKKIYYTSEVEDFYVFTEVYFDFVYPKHCSELNNCIDREEPGVSAGQDFTKVINYSYKKT
jgi:hypothetical protein